MKSKEIKLDQFVSHFLKETIFVKKGNIFVKKEKNKRKYLGKKRKERKERKERKKENIFVATQKEKQTRLAKTNF